MEVLARARERAMRLHATEQELPDAVRRGDIDVVDLLIARGASMAGGANLLEIAVRGGYNDVVDSLIRAGARTGDAERLISIAAHNSNTYLVNQLNAAYARRASDIDSD